MDFLPVLMVALPFLAAIPCWALGRKKAVWGYIILIAVTVLETAAALWLLLDGRTLAMAFPRVMGLGISLKADGFRALYAAVASFMWMMTSLFTPAYMAHGHSRARYCFFTLLTMGATIGVFLSDDLIGAFMFFEIMSFTSYCWVAHEQTPGALRAAQTYLAIAVLGGMAMLMGLMMLYQRVGSLAFDSLAHLAHTPGDASLYLPGALILAGFGAKAGMFPLHVWLPKAHPVAPAPASALLSGVLTKVGIFGILVISSRLFFGDVLWGNVLLVLGLINMFLGALLALFSTDLKRTLACSSMSQIGFILFGIAMQSLLGEHNALAAQGTVLHMLNHSLIKLCLFMAAGVIYINLHQLNLNDIRGFGRKRWGLMTCFLVGAASISGIPMFSGYASKTLLHESIVEYIVHLQHLGESALWYQLAEWVFIITGGITFCYMLKLFIAIFVEKHPTRQEAFDRMGRAMSALPALALGGSALLLFVLGLRPEDTLAPLANRTLDFMHAHAPEHAVVFLAPVNLIGGAKSLIIGIALYLLVVRRWLMGKAEDGRPYLNRWPQRLDLEESLYRPLVSGITRLGIALCTPLDKLVDGFLGPFAWGAFALLARALGAVEVLFRPLYETATFIARTFEVLVDGVSMLLVRTVLRPVKGPAGPPPVGNRLTYALGRAADRITLGARRLFGRVGQPAPSYSYLFASLWHTIQDNSRRILRTLSFSLILFALGFVLLLAYLLTR